MVVAPSGVSLISVTTQVVIFPKRDVSRVHSSELETSQHVLELSFDRGLSSMQYLCACRAMWER